MTCLCIINGLVHTSKKVAYGEPVNSSIYLTTTTSQPPAPCLLLLSILFSSLPYYSGLIHHHQHNNTILEVHYLTEYSSNASNMQNK
jgi:hypothetical protein